MGASMLEETQTWHGSLTWNCHGYRLGLRWQTPEVGAVLDALRLPCWNLSLEEPQGWFSIRRSETGYNYQAPSLEGSAHNELHLAERLERDIHLEVATCCPDRIFIHAGVVSFGGRAILLPGKSFAGKSTLVRALLCNGGEFYSDEYAVVDAQGMVHSYPRHLSLRQNQAPSVRIRAQDLGWLPKFGPIPIALVLCSRYVPEATFSPTRLSLGQGLLELFANTVSAQIQPTQCLNFLTQAISSAECWRATRSDCESVIRWLKGRLPREILDP